MDNVKQLGPGDDIEMMKTPDQWPLGRVLPITRKVQANTKAPTDDHWDQACVSPFSEAGLIFCTPDVPRWTVWRINLLDSKRIRALVRGDAPAASFVSYEYTDAEGIYDDGWRVD